MAAPTWEPPEIAKDEQAEQALLAGFLFADPRHLGRDGRELGTPLRDFQRRLQAWVAMLTGLHLGIAHADPACCDGLRLYLPRCAPEGGRPWSDERLYRGMALAQAGLFHHGFLSATDDHRRLLGELHKDWVLRGCWQLLAARWVLNRYRARYPGVARDLDGVMATLSATRLFVNLTEVPREGLPAGFRPLYPGLVLALGWEDAGGAGRVAAEAVRKVEQASTAQAARLVVLGQARLLRQELRRQRLGPPPVPWWLGVVRPEWILDDLSRDEDAENAWRKGPAPLRQLLASMGGRPERPPEIAPKRRGLRARLKDRLLGGQGEDAELAKMPAYGVLRDEAQAAARARDEEPSADKPLDEEARLYDEWDQAQGAWRFDHCRVTEPEPSGGSLAGWEQVLEANAGAVRQIRRRFEALRQEDRWEGGLPDGPELDLDRAIVAVTDLRAGQQPREDLYRRFVRRRQPLVVATLVDLSGSTQGRVLHLQQEAAILFAEGLRTLGAPHAFFGFNSAAAQDVRLWRLKDFDEGYEDEVRRRLGNLRAEGATRLGAVLRHASWRLAQRREGQRVLLLLSDGKPEARGDYRGDHGVNDSAMAVQEARRAGVHVHCISLDTAAEARDYLDRIFGPGRYLQLARVEDLPLRLPEIFLRLR
jgi:hypothetical protein